MKKRDFILEQKLAIFKKASENGVSCFMKNTTTKE